MRSPMADPYEYGAESLPFEVRQAFWGYAIRSTEGAPVLLRVAQGAVMALGATFVASAMVLLLSPADGDHLSVPIWARRSCSWLRRLSSCASRRAEW